MIYGFSEEFVNKVVSEITPFQHLSGTEHVAPMLYSMIRMTKPKTVVEFGTGYTTPFILLALRHNRDEYLRNISILKRKSKKYFSELVKTERSEKDLESWWLDETTQAIYSSDPVLPNPKYYYSDYDPQLYSFEVLPKNDKYVEKLVRLVEALKLEKLFTLNAGIRVQDYVNYLPEQRLPIDFAWNDFGNKLNFYNETYSHVNANGGILAFHNTTNGEKEFKMDLDRVENKIKDKILEKKCELVTFLEPHKISQRSLTVLRKTEGFKEEFVDDLKNTVDKKLMGLSRLRVGGY